MGTIETKAEIVQPEEAPEPTLEEQIRALIAEQVNGGLSDSQQVRFLELTAQRSRRMRPAATRRGIMARKLVLVG